MNCIVSFRFRFRYATCHSPIRVRALRVASKREQRNDSKQATVSGVVVVVYHIEILFVASLKIDPIRLEFFLCPPTENTNDGNADRKLRQPCAATTMAFDNCYYQQNLVVVCRRARNNEANNSIACVENEMETFSVPIKNGASTGILSTYLPVDYRCQCESILVTCAFYSLKICICW